MMLRRINESLPFPGLRDELDRTFGELFDTVAGLAPMGPLGRRAFPAVNIWEDEKHLYAEAEVPGLTMGDIEVSVLGNELTIRGERKGAEREGVSFHRRERGLGAFSRVLHLPFDVDADRVSAALRDGVLTVTLPKAPSVLPRKIKVNG